MRIVFMGTPGFAVPCLQRLIDDGHELAGVITQPDKPKGRGYALAPPAVKELALANGLAVYQPAGLRTDEAFELISGLAPELIVVVAYGKILPVNILDIPKYGCVNVHGSLLPKYRGAAPIQWSVINGDAEAGVTTMFMAQGMDTGDIILADKTALGAEETSGELYDRLEIMGADCLSRTVRLFEAGTPVPRTPQDEALATSAPMLDKTMAGLDFAKTAAELHNLVRGLSPWPVAHTSLRGKLLKVHRACAAQGFSGDCGEVLDDKRMVIGCGGGALELLEVQEEGGKRMDAKAFMNGKHIKKGEVLA